MLWARCGVDVRLESDVSEFFKCPVSRNGTSGNARPCLPVTVIVFFSCFGTLGSARVSLTLTFSILLTLAFGTVGNALDGLTTLKGFIE